MVANGMDRRSFLGLGAAAAGATAFAFTGCSPKVQPEIIDPTPSPAPSGEAAPAGNGWLGEAPVIAASDIIKTIDTEVVVCGAGTGGCFASAAIAEKGLKTIVIEKGSVVGAVRDDIGGVYSSLQKAEGVQFDKGEMMRQHVMYCSGWVDQDLSRVWLDNSGAAVDWYGKVLDESGKAVLRYEGGYEAEIAAGRYTKFPVGHSPEWFDGQRAGGEVLLAHAQKHGAEVMFDTAFVDFVREGKKISGIIAKTTDGYIQINASKGVVLATGGYAANPVMMEALQPFSLGTLTPIVEGNDSGDGIKACLWMGAAMDETHSTMMFDRGAMLPTETPETADLAAFHVVGSQPFLKVNLNGKRFMNESCPYDFTLHTQSMQPGHCLIEVYDANFMSDIERFSTVGCSRVYPYPNGAPANNPPAALEFMLGNLENQGYLQKADTLEELAQKLNIPTDSFVATCNRYNELFDAQADTDYYKEAYRLSEMRTAPFYGIRLGGFILATMDGIRIDEYMRPITAQHETFEGLYLVGDCSGGYYSGSYPNMFTGHACGRTLTFACRVASILAGELAVK